MVFPYFTLKKERFKAWEPQKLKEITVKLYFDSISKPFPFLK